jgi:GH25 family lysozyme M1 (1,4-beta-N-acetylmuramidase)
LKYREENVNGIKNDKEKIKENMKQLEKKLIQRLNEVEKGLTNKLDILVQENTKFQQDEISKVLDDIPWWITHVNSLHVFPTGVVYSH